MSNKRRANRGNKPTVRWREGGRQRSKAFDNKRDADKFENEINRRKQLGPFAASMLQSEITLDEFVRTDWLPFHGEPDLSENTLRRYKEVWKHVKPRLGGYKIIDITPALLEQFLKQLREDKVGLETRRKALILLSGVLQRALIRGLVPINSARVVGKPRKAIAKLADPLAPITVERIRARLGRFDQMVLDLVAYQGFRPGEAISTDWRQLGDRVIHAHASKTTKARAVKLLDPVVESLYEWRLMSGRPATGLILPRTSPMLTTRRRSVDHASWTLWDWQNWQSRIYRPAAEAAGVTGDLRAYRLRCSFVSLLLWEGRSLTYAADQAGHSVATLANHYAGVIQELEDQPRVPAAEAIRRARAEVRGAGTKSPEAGSGRSGW
jgi:integrase